MSDNLLKVCGKAAPDLIELVTVENCMKVAQNLNFKIFDDNLNIWGVRVPKGDSFNDIFFMFYKHYDIVNDKLDWKTLITFGTTEPSPSYLQTLIGKGGRNPNGIAVLVADRQYLDCWVFGLHKHKYQALQQYWKFKFDCYRKKKDEPIENYYSGKIYTDAQGINFHTTRYGYFINKIVGFSEGCQVAFDAKYYFDKLIPAFRLYKHLKISYTLVNDLQFYNLLNY